LSDAQLQQVHNASLRVLAETGMKVEHDQARELLQAAGACVDHDNQMVRFPPPLVEEKLKLVPRKVGRAGMAQP